VAVALVVGQALLCALVGWLTLGRAQPGSPDGSAGVDRLALPPTGPSPAPTREPAASPRPSAAAGKQSRTAAPTRVPKTPGRKRSASAGQPVPEQNPALLMTTAAKPTLLAEIPSPAPSTLGLVQEPVVAGDWCWPRGAFGRTAQQELVRCVLDHRHLPRWKIV
jgi:hypothetical protein